MKTKLVLPLSCRATLAAGGAEANLHPECTLPANRPSTYRFRPTPLRPGDGIDALVKRVYD